MSKELDQKWRELVKAGKAEWVPGMRAIGRRNMPDACFRLEESVPKLMGEWSQAVPDWSDPGTLGALLGQVRKRYGNPRLYIEPNGDPFVPEGWGLASPNGMVMHKGRVICAATEAGVCLRALECAP